MNVFELSRNADEHVSTGFRRSNITIGIFGKDGSHMWIYSLFERPVRQNRFIPELDLPEKGIFIDKLNQIQREYRYDGL